MPLQSQQQAKYLNWRFGHQWLKEHHFDQPWSNLPKYKAQFGLARVPGFRKSHNPGLLLFRRRVVGFRRPMRRQV